MKRIFLATCLALFTFILPAVIVLPHHISPTTTQAVDATTSPTGLDQNTLNQYMDSQKKKQAEAQKNAQSAQAQNDTSTAQKTQPTYTGWMKALIGIYVLALVLILGILVQSNIALTKWIRKN